METLYVVKDGKVVEYNGQINDKNILTEAAVIESFGRKAIEEINRFGSYSIKKGEAKE
ncbi:hypothetical protein [Paenibacillus tarimensis]|uniref:hypothetical protein n=1 Tax=Paenibacillus tarimensis TaxID=416012 RepID=UPI001F1A32EC|nr:hypothetical protein [Paenibacillus tarimensis]MCF2945740.1 hypothetical protein [Paenibacillus tarimensis]